MRMKKAAEIVETLKVRRGRNSLGAGAQTGISPTLRVRVSPAQFAKVKQRGGSAWVRELIDAG